MGFALRFDFRNPESAGTAMADRYAAALDMAEWADGLGCARITVSEHHGSADGYLPSPVQMLTAMAARTKQVRFLVAALIAPFHDPLRLAEELTVLDNISRGRVDVIVEGGYVREEFAMFDVPMNERGKRVTEVVTTLKSAFTGEPFSYRGRTVRVTPAPYRPGGPAVLLGGSSEPAARRAAPTPVPARSGRTKWWPSPRTPTRAGSGWRRSSCTRPTPTANGRPRTTWPRPSARQRGWPSCGAATSTGSSHPSGS
ncbi:LLM class flavin-dependent oxidoreductase [Streptomyces prunicolor]|uniref:LLM class flavin-dependent oxidoreductase n=1 Tax=Streptomyces prunicolor TaxID=67348 RepID=UPI0034220BE4